MTFRDDNRQLRAMSRRECKQVFDESLQATDKATSGFEPLRHQVRLGAVGWRELAFCLCGLLDENDWWDVVFPLDEVRDDG